MDQTDRRLLALLVREGRSTLQHLADGIHLGSSATRDRLRRLESDGLITGYGARVDEALLGFPIHALIDVDLPPDADDAKFREALAESPAVVEVLHATGEHDYWLRLRCRNIAELHTVVRELKSRHGAARTVTRVVLDEPVRRRPRLP